MASRRAILFVTTIVLLFAGASNARAQEFPTCRSSVEVLFNQYGTTHIAAGSTIWFSSVLEGVQGDIVGKAPIRIDVRQARISFGNWPQVVALPDSTITLDPATRDPQRWWLGNSWSLTYAPSQIPEAFFDGAPFTAPQDFVPGFSGPVTWTATFTASRPGITLRWAWSASAYSKFGVNGWLLVKPLTVPVAGFQNDDPAGTPELFKQYVIPGAMGAGAPQYTGARSGAASIVACVSAEPPARSQAPPPAQGRRFAPPTVMVLRPRPFSVPAYVPAFALPAAQRIELSDGTAGEAVDRCYATDLCATIAYRNGDRLSIYFEGAVSCAPDVLYFKRTNGSYTIYGFSRRLDRDDAAGRTRSRCARSRTTRIVMDGGRVKLTISKNADGSLRFRFVDR